jgi:hypothetical protein
MKYSKIEKTVDFYDPLDLVEDIIINNGWDFERDKNKNIHVEVGGDWCDYQLSYGLNEGKNLIFVSCVLDIRVSKEKIKETHGLLAKINEKLSLGHFEIWLDDGWPIYRCSIPVPNNTLTCRSQIEQISITTLEECEKFYPAFQFLAWGDKTASDSLKHLMLETQGEV